jgi:hypothetical protein
MSHLDGESPAGAFAAGFAESWTAGCDEFWAPRERGTNATNVEKKTKLTYFETRVFMRLPP